MTLQHPHELVGQCAAFATTVLEGARAFAQLHVGVVAFGATAQTLATFRSNLSCAIRGTFTVNCGSGWSTITRSDTSSTHVIF